MAGLDAAAGDAATPPRPAALHGRRPGESAGRARDVSRLLALPHPRLERALDDRTGGVIRLHPYAQRGCHRPLRKGQGRHQGGGDLAAPRTTLNKKGRRLRRPFVLSPACAQALSLPPSPPKSPPTSISPPSKSLSPGVESNRPARCEPSSASAVCPPRPMSFTPASRARSLPLKSEP